MPKQTKISAFSAILVGPRDPGMCIFLRVWRWARPLCSKPGTMASEAAPRLSNILSSDHISLAMKGTGTPKRIRCSLVHLGMFTPARGDFDHFRPRTSFSGCYLSTRSNGFACLFVALLFSRGIFIVGCSDRFLDLGDVEIRGLWWSRHGTAQPSATDIAKKSMTYMTRGLKQLVYMKASLRWPRTQHQGEANADFQSWMILAVVLSCCLVGL